MRCILTLIPVGLLAAPPVIRDITPHGAQRGKTIQLVLKGSDLTPGAKLQTTLPASISRLGPSKDLTKAGAELPFLVELKKDAPVGLYPIRLLTEDGLSNVLLFSIGDLPELDEKEIENPKQSNADIKSAEPVTTPVVINGTLPDADVDVYAFKAATNQKLVFEVEASVAASAIDPALDLLDSTGKVIARNDDAPGNGIDSRIEHTFLRAGSYYLRIHDSKYSTQDVNFYRLKIGSYPFAEAMFPLGWRRGQPVSVELTGGNLAQPVSLRPDTNSARRFVSVSVPNSSSLPQLFTLSDKPEILEPDTTEKELPPGTIVNGRIAKKGEVDKYRLSVKPGDQWIFEIAAASTGASRLDALLTIYDAGGKKLTSRDDIGGGADPVIPFDVPKDVKEVTVAIEDLLGRGGPAYAYRLEARKEAADFVVQMVTPFVNVPLGGTSIVNVNVQRRGYDGTVRVFVEGLPKGFTQAGGHVAPAAAAQRFDDPNPRFSAARTTLTITAPPDAEPVSKELRILAVADTPQGRIVRYGEGPGLAVGVKGLRQKAVTASWLEMELPFATTKPVPVQLATTVPLVRISQGVEFPLNYRVQRGMNGRIQGRVKQTVASQVGNLRILQGPPGKTPDVGSLLINTNFATPTTKFDFYVSATAEVEGKPVEVYGPMVTVEVVPGYQVRPDFSTWALKPGAQLTATGKIYREPTFEGSAVRVEVQELPEGVTCQPAEVAGADFSLSCQAAPSSPKGAHEIRLVSQAPETGSKAKDTYKGPEVPVQLRID